jgi:hypothetical protein
MLASFIVKVVEEELTLRPIPEGCNIQSFLVLVIKVKPETSVHLIRATKEFWSGQKLKCF